MDGWILLGLIVIGLLIYALWGVNNDHDDNDPMGYA